MPKYFTQMNLRLSRSEQESINKNAHRLKISKAELVRLALRNFYESIEEDKHGACSG